MPLAAFQKLCDAGSSVTSLPRNNCVGFGYIVAAYLAGDAPSGLGLTNRAFCSGAEAKQALHHGLCLRAWGLATKTGSTQIVQPGCTKRPGTAEARMCRIINFDRLLR